MIGREGLHRQVLLDIVEAAGGRDARSYISTGNVSFDADPDGVADLVAIVEGEITGVVGRPTQVFVRRLTELETMVSVDPFAEPPFEPVERIVAFFRDAVPGTFAIPTWSDRRDIAVIGSGRREIFCINREVDGRVRGPGGWVERTGGQPVTTRAWGTITRIVDKLA